MYNVPSLTWLTAIAAAAALMVFVVYENKNIRFFLSIALICFLVNFTLREIEWMFFREKNMVVFSSLVRNDKWIYFFCFLTVVACYPNLRGIIARHRNRYAIGMLAFAFVGFVVYLSHGPLSRAAAHNYLGMKVFDKFDLCKVVNEKSRHSVFAKFCPDGNNVGITAVNADASKAADFMKQLPSQHTFAGPNWLRYKAHRSVVYNREDGFFFLVRNDPNYFVWKEQDRIYNSLVKFRLLVKDTQKILHVNGTDWEGARSKNPAAGWDVGGNPGSYDVVDTGETSPFDSCLRVMHNGDSDYPYMASRAVPTEIGREYKFSFWFKKGTEGDGVVGIGTTWGNGQYKTWRRLNDSVWTQYSHVFKAKTKQTYIYMQCRTQDKGRYDLFDEVSLSDVTPVMTAEEILEEAGKIGSDYLFLEKFKHTYHHEGHYYSFQKKNYDLSGLLVVYENDSFAIINLRSADFADWRRLMPQINAADC